MNQSLECVLEAAAPVAVLRLTGRLDPTSAPAVQLALTKALTAQPSAIVVDLCEVTVDDDRGLSVFGAVGRTAAGWPGCPVLLSASSALRARLARLSVSRTLAVYPDRAQALAAAATLPPPQEHRQWLRSTPAAAHSAREAVAAACRDWNLPSLVDDAELLVTELVSNAVRHAGGEMELAIVVREHFLHMSVRDSSPNRPRRMVPDPHNSEGGRGLILIDAVAAGWGSIPTPDGKVVWATLPMPR
ncbi:MAG: hypothetical protein QOI74_2250 [Micromonosporaceae bacterium]|nr:hypothetical protein [Micromonosporaceae bacterium]MDT5035312.1 hypothetical protein [Micromonosporaceae bacterium]